MVKKVSSKAISTKSKKAPSKTVKKVKERKPRIPKIEVQIADAILEECDNDPNILVLDYTGGMAIMLKKHEVTVQGVRNPNGMQPYQEPPRQKTFFHTFVLQWDGKPLAGNMVDMGVPVTWVETPREALKAISNA